MIGGIKWVSFCVGRGVVGGAVEGIAELMERRVWRGFGVGLGEGGVGW